MHLKTGQTVLAETNQVSLTVKTKLGEGGQGIVYLVTGPNGDQAVKWYNREQAIPDQQEAIRRLVASGPPKGPAGKRFVWPLDLVTVPGNPLFGYLMPLIDTKRFAELGEVWARRKPAPSLPALCKISYQAANSYRALHLEGYCYRDISKGNLMFDPLSGDVLICDNDNVGVNRYSPTQVWGTPEYVAPEVVLGQNDPSTETDLHSLAVLLFNLWVWHHPFHGMMEYQIRSWDLAAKRRVYGESPVFIFDPKDNRNALPNDPDYVTPRKRWELLPTALQLLFIRAFTEGLKSPEHRVTEGEWQRLFLLLYDSSLECSHCKAGNIIDPRPRQPIACWNCRKAIHVPPRLVIDLRHETVQVLLHETASLLRRHIDPSLQDDSACETIGQVVRNPNNPSIWGIRNLSPSPWSARLSDGSFKEVGPQQAVPLNPGLELYIDGVRARIVS